MAAECLGDATCEHFLAVSSKPSAAVIQHGDNPEHRHSFKPGYFPDGLCSDGHDVTLEHWIHEVMDREGCVPA